MTQDGHDPEYEQVRSDAINDVLSRFESLAAGYRTVGNYDAWRGVQDLCDEIRKYGV